MEVGFIFGKAPVDHGSSSLKRYLNLLNFISVAMVSKIMPSYSAGPPNSAGLLVCQRLSVASRRRLLETLFNVLSTSFLKA